MNKSKIGMYLRLSKDDNIKFAESNSISSQRYIIKQFICNSLEEADSMTEYVDDGYTGLDFNRPGMLRMLQDIENKRVNCVIVKDLSRLGRDYLETGKLVFNDFPARGVRFIAIDDGYDTYKQQRSDSIMMPFKTIMNNYYSMDISVKVQEAFRAKQREGEFTGSFAGYGYQKDPMDKHKLIIDENVAPIVRRVFDMYIQGYGKQTIANILNTEKIPSPCGYKKLMGSNYTNSHKLEHTDYWTYSTIANMLKNEMYIGNMVLNKYGRFKPRAKAKKNAKEKWIITEGTHEAIISKEKWDTVQTLLKKRGRTLDFESNVSIFAGFIVCADCGRALSKITSKKGGKVKICYVCGSYKRYGAEICTRHNVPEEVLKKAILDKLNEYVVKSEIAIDNINRKKGLDDATVTRYTSAIDGIKIKKKKLYDSYVNEIISLEEYKDYKRDYEAEEEKYQALLDAANYENEELVAEKKKWLEYLVEHKRFEELDRAILVEVLDKIYVREDSEGIHIDIRFKFRLE